MLQTEVERRGGGGGKELRMVCEQVPLRRLTSANPHNCVLSLTSLGPIPHYGERLEASALTFVNAGPNSAG